MKFLFFNPDGRRVSGVFSYCQLLLASHPDCLVLSLNEDAGPESDDEGCFFTLPFARSHDVEAVAECVERIARRYPLEPLVLLPNNGMIPFLVCLRLLEKSTELRERLRILAIIHSDHTDSYCMALRYSEQVARFIGVSPVIARKLSVALPERLHDISCLPYPVRIPAHASETFYEVKAPLRLVYAGRLEEKQKRVSRITAVATRLADAGIPFILDIYGQGEAYPRLAAAIHTLSPALQPSVRLVGAASLDEIHRRLPFYDVLLLVSSYEGTPIILLEAMAAGLCPVVMSIESGVPDLVVDAVTGRVVPQGDTDLMAEAIAELSCDRQALALMKRAARDLVESQYAISEHLNSLDQVLHACAAAPLPESPIRGSPMDIVISDLVRRARSQPLGANVLWGGGMFGRCLADACLAENIALAAVVDVDVGKQGRVYRGLPDVSPDRVPGLSPNQVLVGSAAFSADVYRQILELYDHAGLPCPRVLLPRHELQCPKIAISPS